ncbi:MAG: methanogen output domain 1-containing protein [Anaerolineaceae bacterium]|nr:methanogen output domain 1-containing protein [Anaerolineaceae bacterium]
MTTTRDQILQTLLDNPRSTIKNLADSVNINAISVRHHLASLQAESLVSFEEERHGVGRPRLVYSLTEKGTEVFPSNYLQFTDRLLGQLHKTLSSEEVEALFVNMAHKQVEELKPEFEYLTNSEEKIEYLVKVLSEEGHSTTWTKQEDGSYLIKIANCPYIHISKSHPVICNYDRELFNEILDMDVEKVSSICFGDQSCSYRVEEKA